MLGMTSHLFFDSSSSTKKGIGEDPKEKKCFIAKTEATKQLMNIKYHTLMVQILWEVGGKKGAFCSKQPISE